MSARRIVEVSGGAQAEERLRSLGLELAVEREPYGPGEYLKIQALLPDGRFAATLGVVTEPRDGFAEVSGVFVDPAYRRKGIATLLYRAMAKELQRLGVRLVGGEVAAQATFDLRRKVFGEPEYVADVFQNLDPDAARARLPAVMHDERDAQKVYVRSRVGPRRRY